MLKVAATRQTDAKRSKGVRREGEKGRALGHVQNKLGILIERVGSNKRVREDISQDQKTRTWRFFPRQATLRHGNQGGGGETKKRAGGEKD